MSGEAIILWVLLVVLLSVTSLAWLTDYTSIKPAQRKQRILGMILHGGLGLTVWVWGPWMLYGVSTFYTWNVGKINDLSKPPQVQPPTVITRPSAADQGVEQ
jgi:hypothetical protein